MSKEGIDKFKLKTMINWFKKIKFKVIQEIIN